MEFYCYKKKFRENNLLLIALISWNFCEGKLINENVLNFHTYVEEASEFAKGIENTKTRDGRDLTSFMPFTVWKLCILLPPRSYALSILGNVES